MLNVTGDDIASRSRVLEYCDRVFRRNDGPDEVVDPGFQPNWADRPAQYRVYPHSPRFQLSSTHKLFQRYSEMVLAAGTKSPSIREALSVALCLASGPLQRQLEINWNIDTRLDYVGQEFRRGSASGGGLYPTQMYIVSDGYADCVPFPGVHFYANGQHALVPLRHGDFTEGVSASIGADTARRYGQYLILSSDFWQNCFKYNNFGYHVCSQDVGLILATLQLVFEALALPHRVFLTFADATVNAIIGADGESEGAFAIIGIGEAANARPLPRRSAPQLLPMPSPRQKSRNVAIAPAIIEMHAATMLDQRAMEALADVGTRLDHGSSAPAQSALEHDVVRDLPRVLKTRRSAWSNMRGGTLVNERDVTALLEFIDARSSRSGLNMREQVPDGAIGMSLQLHSVRGIAPGAYRWDTDAKCLSAVSSVPPKLWQSIYSMTNYNVDEAAAVLFLTGNVNRVVECFGPRGYRILNAHIGARAQNAYIGSTRLKLSCGAVLGLRAQRVKNIIELPGGHEVFLGLFLGASQDRARSFDFSLIPDISGR